MPLSPDPVWTRRFSAEEQEALAQEATAGAAARAAAGGAAPLAGLRFAVKDLIAVRGCVMGCGNPHWAARQQASTVTAPAVQLLLAAGARCLGTTWLDEFAFGLAGENAWGGTPPNPRAPGRIPGGSSSGSAAAVALGEADLALGTDTAGSIRAPASWCGLWGLRPSHGSVGTDGVAPLAPSLDTVGLFASSHETLRMGMATLLEPIGSYNSGILVSLDPTATAATTPSLNAPFSTADQSLDGPAPSIAADLIAAPQSDPAANPIETASTVRAIGWIPELWTLADPAVAAPLEHQARSLAEQLGLPLQRWPLAELGIGSPEDLQRLLEAVQWAEIEQCLAHLPSDLPVGPSLARNRALVAGRDRSLLEGALIARQALRERLHQLLAPGSSGRRPALLLLPCTPTVAPPCGSLGSDRSTSTLIQRLLQLGALASLAGLPQLARPGSVDAEQQLPVGLGVLTHAGGDRLLLDLPEP
jgi:amidase